ncbi:MAG: DUF4118 domain-containing protein [Acidobacteriaceae bacterium]|nr:DUF4118 domain-containing protein [Acidobacteriaceae bacterium]
MRPKLRFFQGMVSVGSTLAVSVVCYRLLHANAATAAVVLFLIVLLTGAYAGFAEAIVVSIAAAVCLDYFFIPPIGSISIGDPQGWIILLAFLVVAIFTSFLSSSFRRQRNEIADQQSEAEKLHIFSRSMLLSSTATDIRRLTVNKCIELFGFRATVLFESAAGSFQSSMPESDATLEEQLRRIASRGETIESGKDGWTVLPVTLGNKSYGSLAVAGRHLPESTYRGIANTVALGLAQAQAHQSLTRAEAVRKSEELKSTMIDALAHDLKTPLTAIEAAAEMLSAPSEVSAEQQADLVTIIKEESGGLRRLVDEAIHLARIDAKRLKLKRTSVPARELIESAVTALPDRTAAGRIQIDVGDPRTSVFADPELLPIAIRQFLDNALKYSPPQSPVLVTASAEGGYVSIRVRDQGQGLTELEQSRVFEKLYRGRRDRSAVQGTGMGLPIAKEIAEAHGGAAGVYSHVGKGSEFFLVIQQGGTSSPAADGHPVPVPSGNLGV